MRVAHSIRHAIRGGAFLLAVASAAGLARMAQAQCGGRWLTDQAQTVPGFSYVWEVVVLSNGDVLASGWGWDEGSQVARWNGSTWSAFASGSIAAFAELPNGHIVVGGSFTTAGGVAANRVARWNGTSWLPLGSGITGAVPPYGCNVYALLAMPNGDVVVGGRFTTAGGQPASNIARWDGSAWRPLGAGLDGEVAALAAMPNGDIIAAGLFAVAGDATAGSIARWDGVRWHALSSGMDYAVLSLAILEGGELVAGGEFTVAGGVVATNVARWDGASWTPMGAGISGPVRSLAALPGGGVVAAGDFWASGGSVNNIARWNGASWHPYGDGLNGPALSVAVLPSGGIFTGGEFTTAGGLPSGCWAQWTDTGAPWTAEAPLSRLIDAGANCELAAICAAGFDFDGAVTFQWLHDGVPVTDGPGGASSGGGLVSGASGSLPAANTSSTLRIEGVRPSDAGDYAVVFTNGCGSSTSAAATVTVVPSCPSDLNGDGAVTGADLGVLLGEWGTPGGSVGADLNDDGLVTGADLGILLGDWGSCTGSWRAGAPGSFVDGS